MESCTEFFHIIFHLRFFDERGRVLNLVPSACQAGMGQDAPICYLAGHLSPIFFLAKLCFANAGMMWNLRLFLHKSASFHVGT